MKHLCWKGFLTFPNSSIEHKMNQYWGNKKYSGKIGPLVTISTTQWTLSTNIILTHLHIYWMPFKSGKGAKAGKSSHSIPGMPTIRTSPGSPFQGQALSVALRHKLTRNIWPSYITFRACLWSLSFCFCCLRWNVTFGLHEKKRTLFNHLNVFYLSNDL